MNHDVEAVPVLPERSEGLVDLTVVFDVQRHRDLRVKLSSDALNAPTKSLRLVAERELCALCVHRLGDAVGDRAITRNASDESALARKKPHGMTCCMMDREAEV